MKKYRNALRKLDWEDNDASFYRWIAVEAEHDISPNSKYFKEFQTIWTGKAENCFEKMDMDKWEFHRNFYKNLCVYGVCIFE